MWEQILSAAISAHRAGNGCGGRSMLFARQVRTQAEAQVLGTIARELLCGNLDGARSCLRALTEDVIPPMTAPTRVGDRLMREPASTERTDHDHRT